ncbi:MAG: L,D-transpeptidase [Phenylobacterium sp.]|uniref:L,D-transpeptidase family protein n=1 Tax=Phenylobacterium sp. TaxID=1871053 RepID=UPI00391CCC03
MIFTAHSDGRFELGSRTTRCALGRSGVVPAEDKREGDGCSPLGVWPIRRVLFRLDRIKPPPTRLPLAPIAEDDGWCDAPGDRNYNRPVKLPYPASCERMWRDDHLYDLVCVLAHNDDPPVPLMGSAIFLHVARPDFEPTEGCVALLPGDLAELIRMAEPGSAVSIVDVNPHPVLERAGAGVVQPTGRGRPDLRLGPGSEER